MDRPAIARLAERQLGLVTFDQLLEHGMTPRQIERRASSGVYERLHLGVLRIAGAPRSYRQRLLGACLAIGPEAAASHRAASTVHDLLRYREPPVEVTTTRLRSPEVGGVIVHRIADLTSRWTDVVDGVPTTSVARTLVDLGAVAGRRTVEAALDRAVGRKLVVFRDVRDAMVAVARKGRRGVGTIRSLLEARIGEVMPAGVFSATMASLFRNAGLPKPVHEFTVVDEHGGFVGVVDFAYPEQRLAIEADSYEFHSSPSAIKSRNQRDRLLAEADWLVLHYSWEEVDRRSHAVGAEIRRHYSAR